MDHVRFRAGFRRDERGATAIEFALVAPLLFFALLSLVEIGMLGMMVTSLDNSVIEVSRRIRTGRDDGPTSMTTFKNQVCANMGGSTSACISRLRISVQKYSTFGNANTAVTAAPNDTFDKGGPDDIVLVKADYTWPLMSPFIATAYQHAGPMSVVLSSRLAFKNEPYQ
jgi:Flp pilus assembly protein TadG